MESKQIVNVFNFSGGLTSAYMTLKYYKPGDIVLFCDTGREHPITYKFIDDFSKNENIPILKTSYKNSKNAFDFYLEEKKYNFLPGLNQRTCTVDLKILTAKRFLPNEIQFK